MKPVAALFLLASTSAAFAQTHTAKPAVTHRAATPSSTPALVLNPPGAPKVVGPAKTLYTLRYVDTKIGTGEVAEPRKFYTVHYTGYLTNGKKFDSSVDRGQPITFPYGLHRVIIGWDTGFEGMRVGGKRRLFIPYQLAYGDTAKDPIPAKSDLVFDVELVGMSDAPPAPPAQPRPAEPAPSSAPASTPPASTAPGSGVPGGVLKPSTPPPSSK